eukprot:TRINITY_DN27379_c0_g1_i1.p1 TRINITY_DN27379_c0_g1~~TRINITY_DN27379_c0_g1_i1.p1  ORF type:complete len:556 (+),score=119.74 TRINITY_DN27379_c0_g1_i1:80-1747(+)
MKMFRLAAACTVAFGPVSAELDCPRGATCPVKVSESEEAGEALLQRTAKKQTKAPQPEEEEQIFPPSILEESAKTQVNATASSPCLLKVFTDWTSKAGAPAVNDKECLPSGGNVVSARAANSVRFRVSKLGDELSIGLADGNTQANAQAKFTLIVEGDGTIALGDRTDGGALFKIYGKVEPGDVLQIEYSDMMVKWMKNAETIHTQVYMVPLGKQLHAYGTITGDTGGELCRLSFKACRDVAGRRANCYMSGDPHVKPFDGTRHFHPMHAPGHWWLVRTELDVLSIQGRYEACGWKQGGWQSARLNDVPRTCLTAMAFGGRLLRSGDKENKLVIMAPCQWDWQHSRCTNTDKTARMYWNGEKITHLDSASPYVRVWYEHGRMNVKLPSGVEVHIWFGWAPTGAAAMMATNIHMTQGAIGFKQCGHCGDFDNDATDDMQLYAQTGLLKALKAPPLCDAAVHCRDRLIPTDTPILFASDSVNNCVENQPGETFGLEDCPVEELEEARRHCVEAFGHVTISDEGTLEEDLRDCMLDECLMPGFAPEDAKEAEEIAEDE